MPSGHESSKHRSKKRSSGRRSGSESDNSHRRHAHHDRSVRRSESKSHRRKSSLHKRVRHSSSGESHDHKHAQRASKHVKREYHDSDTRSHEDKHSSRRNRSRESERRDRSDRHNRSQRKNATSSSKLTEQSSKSVEETKPFMVPMLDNKEMAKQHLTGVCAQNISGNFSPSCNLDSRFTQERTQTDQRKKRSRWAENETGRIYIPGLPTTLPPNLSKDQEKAYLLQLQIEEMTRRLRLPNLGIPDNPSLRSPSPEPVYDQYGKRSNTREARTRKKLEDDRHLLVLEMYKLNPEYKPPVDYKPQQIKYTDKVDIPQDDFPEINFVGLLIGPRGNSLKSLEKETGAKIIIRGKGSVKDGKLARKEAGPLPGEDEPLHAYITGTTIEVVERAKIRINEIIQQGIEIPESMNELRRQQLRELALLNGTLRENECLNKLKILTEAETIVTNTIICPICGSAGHIASDCMMRGSLTKEQLEKLEKESVDTEYSALMKELGHTVSANQLKCLSSVIARGALMSSNTGLALPSTTERITEDGETEVTISLGRLAAAGDIPEDEIPPLMPSGRLVVPRNPNAVYGASTQQASLGSLQKRLVTPSEDQANSFFAETAQKWINDSVFTDPTIAIAAAALSQYAYHPNRPTVAPVQQAWPMAYSPYPDPSGAIAQFPPSWCGASQPPGPAATSELPDSRE